MATRYTVRTVLFASGERFPILVDCDSGVPLGDPTIFSVVELRARNLASATIEQVARALSVFYLFTQTYQINIDERISQGKLLELSEVDALLRFCRLSLDVLPARVGCGARPHDLTNLCSC